VQSHNTLKLSMENRKKQGCGFIDHLQKQLKYN